jgi:hypothetical protein
VRFTAVNCHSSIRIIPELQTRTKLYVSESALSVLVKRIKRKDGSGGRENPGGIVINGSPTKEPSHAIQSLPSCLGEPVAVIQDSHVDPLLLQLLPLLLACPSSVRGFSVASSPGADQSRLEPPKFSLVQSTIISHWDRTSAQFLRTGPESVWTGSDCLSWHRDY